MKFWTLRHIIAVIGIISTTYLAVIGFQGHLSPIVGAIGWLLVSFSIVVDLICDGINHRMEKVHKEFLDSIQEIIRCSCKEGDGCCKCDDKE